LSDVEAQTDSPETERDDDDDGDWTPKQTKSQQKPKRGKKRKRKPADAAVAKEKKYVSVRLKVPRPRLFGERVNMLYAPRLFSQWSITSISMICVLFLFRECTYTIPYRRAVNRHYVGDRNNKAGSSFEKSTINVFMTTQTKSKTNFPLIVHYQLRDGQIAAKAKLAELEQLPLPQREQERLALYHHVSKLQEYLKAFSVSHQTILTKQGAQLRNK